MLGTGLKNQERGLRLRKLSAEAERELALEEKRLQDAHVDRLDPEVECILVILPSTHSTGILMQREDNILEWIFFELGGTHL